MQEAAFSEGPKIGLLLQAIYSGKTVFLLGTNEPSQKKRLLAYKEHLSLPVSAVAPRDDAERSAARLRVLRACTLGVGRCLVAFFCPLCCYCAFSILGCLPLTLSQSQRFCGTVSFSLVLTRLSQAYPPWNSYPLPSPRLPSYPLPSGGV
jgi:hypothetical protein